MNNELQEMIDRETIAAAIDAFRKLGRADSKTAMPIQVDKGRATKKSSGSAFDEFCILAKSGVDFAVIQNQPNPLQGFAKFNPEDGTIYELVAPHQEKVLKDLTGFVVPITPGLFLSQNRIAGVGKILELPGGPKMPEDYVDVQSSSETLRDAQREAVRKLNAPMSFIWGPPGTGKTYTISQVILEIVSQGGKVVVTSTADKAVKGALHAVTKFNEAPVCEFLEDSDPKNDPYRDYDRKMKACREETDKEEVMRLKEAALSSLRDAKAIFLNSLRLIANQDKIVQTGRPTHIIIDEVSMMTMYMISLIRNAFPKAKLIFVGDPNQLSPVVIDSTVAKSPYGMNIYQFAGLNDPRLSTPGNFVTFLDQTSRIPARLTQAISNKWYSGALKSTRKIGEFKPLCEGQPEVVYDCSDVPDGGLNFPEPKYSFGRNSNKSDACTVVKVAKIALDNQREVMIVTPYTAQVRLINHYLKVNRLDSKVQATTVHKAQGAEADIVIWSVVANNPHFNKPGKPQADMIATVALSRAKQQVFIVGAQEGTVAYNFIQCYENIAQAPTPEVSTEVSGTPELTPDEDYRNELAASAAEEFLAQETPEYNGPTTVVNIDDNSDYDVYIGRAVQGFDGYFGNPIVQGEKCCVCGEKHFDNESIVTCYRKRFDYLIEEDEEFAERISQLKGKRLGCFCKPRHCHGDVIAEYLESPEDTGSDLSFKPVPAAPQSQPELITFSKTKNPYGEFGNMASGYPIKVHDGPVWPSSEHLYQACKFQDKGIRQQILAQKNAYLMKQNVARPNQHKMRADWDEIKDSVMEWCVSLKLVQNPSVLQTLHGTGNATIVEYSTKDHYWGASKVDGQWQGLNKLGSLLMYLRDNRDDLNRIAIQGLHPAYACDKFESFTPALAYAGIGARTTPREVLQYMTEQATLLEKANCLLRTGDAKGADRAFCDGATHKSVYAPEQPILDWAREKVAEVCDSDYNTYKPIARNLLARSMYQLFGDGNTPDACYPSKFVLYWSKPSSEYNSSQQDNYFNCSNGTRYAVRAAVKAGIPTFNLYNQKELWEQYRDNGFEFPQLSEAVEQVVEPEPPSSTPEPERDMTEVQKHRVEMLDYVMQLLYPEDEA
jgi:ribA/ribD-fused uncharacterized protein